MSQLGTANKIRVEEQSVSGGTRSFLRVDGSHLSRCKTDNGSFLVVVRLPAVGNVSAERIFQKQGIDAIIYGKWLCRLSNL